MPKGTLSRADMIGIIARGEGVLHKGRIITRLDQLPPEEDLVSDDPTALADYRARLEADLKEMEASLAKVEKMEQQTAAQLDKERAAAAKASEKADEAKAKEEAQATAAAEAAATAEAERKALEEKEAEAKEIARREAEAKAKAQGNPK